MLTWQIVVWAYLFVGATHEWVVSRFGDAWGAVASAVAYLAQAGLGIQVLVAVFYIAIGVWFSFQAKPGTRTQDRVVAGALWLPFLAVMLGGGLAIMAYILAAVVAVGGVIGLLLLLFEAAIRGVLDIALR